MRRTPRRELCSEAAKQSLRFAETAGYEKAHTEQVRALALTMFDGLKALHGLGGEDRGLLEQAAILHDIGWAEGGKGHHKAVRDMILSAPSLIFDSPVKRVIVALVARYHKGSCPAREHRYYADLSGADRLRVDKLAAILRIADGLDRSHAAAVKDLSIKTLPGKIKLRIKARSVSGADDAAAKKKADLFRCVFKKEVEFEWSSE